MSDILSRRSFLAGTGAVAAGLSFSSLGFGQDISSLNFLNWDTYIGETTLDDFFSASGIKVDMELFPNNDVLYHKIKNSTDNYDIIVPTDTNAARLISENILLPLDHKLIPNFKNLESRFQTENFDPNRRYTIPYMWGTIGIGYRKSQVKERLDSWKWLYDSDMYSGRIALLGESSTVIQMALKYLGKSLNTTDPAEIKQAENLIIKQKPHIYTFAEDNGQDLLLAGEVDIVMEWNGDIQQSINEDSDIDYIIPREGGLLWQDVLCIPKTALNPVAAHEFINFLLDAQIGADIAGFIQYATPNAEAKKLLDLEYQNNPAIYPSKSILDVSETALYLGAEYEKMIAETWERINQA